MSGILGDVGQLISSAISWLQAFLAAIVGGSGTIGSGNDAVSYNYAGSDVLIIFVIALPLVGLGIGLLRRLIKTRG